MTEPVRNSVSKLKLDMHDETPTRAVLPMFYNQLIFLSGLNYESVDECIAAELSA